MGARGLLFIHQHLDIYMQRRQIYMHNAPATSWISSDVLGGKSAQASASSSSALIWGGSEGPVIWPWIYMIVQLVLTTRLRWIEYLLILPGLNTAMVAQNRKYGADPLSFPTGIL